MNSLTLKAMLLISVLLISGLLFGQKTSVKPLMDSVNTINKETLISDLDDYIKLISEKHISPFTKVSKATLEQEIQKIKDAAPNEDVNTILTRFMKLNALIGDAHTSIIYWSADIFPYWCYWFKEGIFIMGADKQDSTLLFAKIIAVNDVPISEVERRIYELIQEKNSAALKEMIPRYLFDPFILHGLQICAPQQQINYTLVLDNGDTTKLYPTVKKRSEVQKIRWAHQHVLLRDLSKDPYWFKYLDTSKILYFAYKSCIDDHGHPFEKFQSELLKEIKHTSPQKLIIDLRYNRGGYAELLKPFIDKLHKFEFAKNKQIYVLIGRTTFSAAILNAIDLKQRDDVMLVGEETSGNVSFYAGANYYKLPKTKLMVEYSTYYFSNPQFGDGNLKPDIPIVETLSDYRAGVDAAIQYVLTH